MKTYIGLSVDQTTKEAAQKQAKVEKRSLNIWVELLIEEKLKQIEAAKCQ